MICCARPTRPLTRTLSAVVLGVMVGRTPMPVHAASQQTVGCVREGYTIQVPQAWAASGNCTAFTVAVSPDAGMWLDIRVRPRAAWSQQQAQADIADDIQPPGGAPVVFRSLTIQQQQFVEGRAAAKDSYGNPRHLVELATFQRGLVYSFFVSYIASTDPSASLLGPGNGMATNAYLPAEREAEVALLWTSIRLTRR